KDEVQRYVFIVGRSEDGREASIKITNKTPWMPPPTVEDPNPWIELFNGVDLTGWTVGDKDGDMEPAKRPWKGKDGEIVFSLVSETKEKFRLISNREFADFRLRLEFQLDDKLKAGVRVRSPRGQEAKGGPGMVCLGEWAPKLKTGYFLWSGFAKQPVVPNPEPQLRPGGRWNEMEIDVQGHRQRVWINGQQILDFDREELSKDPRAMPGLARREGAVGFQGQTGTLRLRKIAVRPYKSGNDWLALFNGKDLTGWKTLPQDKARWEVKDGILTSAGPVGHLYTDRADFTNFHFLAEARINDRG